ncbi:MAG: HAMP domain-containing histidine kinase, partial [Candidatus Lokiarchaeota archaeon]|nr:HAMP domain-containing histidine kinase [Candidatus Lokiarchaeota archaeon]
DKVKGKSNYILFKRASKEDILDQSELFKNNEILNLFLNKIPSISFIINEYRQIVYMNKYALEFSKINDLSEAIGKRVGELLNCIHSNEGKGGCGTSEACSYCGALNAFLTSHDGKPTVEDCQIILGPNKEAFDLRVWAHPTIYKGTQIYILTVKDIKHEKRSAVYERIFFHDLLNTITGLNLNIQMLKKKDCTDKDLFLERADYFVKNLIEEIQSHQILNAAENGDLLLRNTKINSIEFLKDILSFYEFQSKFNSKIIKIDVQSKNITFNSDTTIIKRIIKNMTINAIEATSKDDIITIGCKSDNNQIIFEVNNPGIMSKNIQLQLFKRSFSTKGHNRGLGTYSMKLLSSFIRGEIDFRTSKENGTTFFLSIPLNSVIQS